MAAPLTKTKEERMQRRARVSELYIEEIFGWMKTVGMLRKTRHRGVDRVGWMFTFGVAVYSLVRMRNMMEAPT